MTLNVLCKHAGNFVFLVCKRPFVNKLYIRTLRGRARVPIVNPQSSADFQEFLDDNSDDLFDAVIGKEQRKMEEFITSVDFTDPDVIGHLQRLDKIERNKLKRKIIQRKYFKTEPEISVLTWQAKEQIRYLNQEYPEEWTVEKLVDSFPVSYKGVLAVLKSSYIPQDEKEIRKHDDKAFQNIQTLKEKLHDKSLNIEPEEKERIESIMKKVGNASGIKSLPLTQLVTRRSIAAQSKLLKPSSKIGPFRSMLMYYDRINSGETVVDKKYEILPLSSDTTEQITDGKCQEVKQIRIGAENNNNIEKTETKCKEKYIYDSKSKSLNKGQKYNEQKLDNHSSFNRSNSEVSREQKFISKSNIKTDMQSRSEKCDSSSRNLSQTMENLSSKNFKLTVMQNENVNDFVTGKRIQKWRNESEVISSDTFGKTITIRTTANAKRKNENKYSKNSIKSIKGQKEPHKMSTYTKGKDVYDDQGEFLYRIP